MRITSNRTTFIGPTGDHVRSVPDRADEETVQKWLTKSAVLPAGINELLQRRRFLMMESVLDRQRSLRPSGPPVRVKSVWAWVFESIPVSIP